jgi:hypothetical protein
MGIRPSQTHYIHTGQHKHTEEGTQTAIPLVGFEPRTPVLERGKTIHAIDRAVTVNGLATNNTE